MVSRKFARAKRVGSRIAFSIRPQKAEKMKPTVRIHEQPRPTQKLWIDGRPFFSKGPKPNTIIVVAREDVTEEWEEFPGYACELRSTRPTKS